MQQRLINRFQKSGYRLNIGSGMFNGIFEIVIHDMPKEQAMRYVDQLRDFYTAGWLKLIGQS